MLFLHCQNYDIIWMKGVATTAIVEYRFGLVRRKDGPNDLPQFRGVAFIPEFRRMDYLLVRGDIPERDQENFQEFTLLRASGKWALYKRTSSHARSSIDSTRRVVFAGSATIPAFSGKRPRRFPWRFTTS
jgi:hypothetical protein